MSLLSADVGVRKEKQKIIDLVSKFKSAEHPQAPREEILGKVMSRVSSAWQYFSQLTQLSRCPTSKLQGKVRNFDWVYKSQFNTCPL